MSLLPYSIKLMSDSNWLFNCCSYLLRMIFDNEHLAWGRHFGNGTASAIMNHQSIYKLESIMNINEGFFFFVSPHWDSSQNHSSLVVTLLKNELSFTTERILKRNVFGFLCLVCFLFQLFNMDISLFLYLLAQVMMPSETDPSRTCATCGSRCPGYSAHFWR